MTLILKPQVSTPDKPTQISTVTANTAIQHGISENGGIIGVGILGFKKKEVRNLTRDSLNKHHLVTVRDHRSRKQLEPLYNEDIHVTACPALLHEPPQVTNSGKTGVNFRPWFNLDSETLSYYFDYEDDINVHQARERYIENAIQLCQEATNPVFIPFNKRDEQFAYEYLDIDILPFKFSVKQTLERVGAVDRMITMRYHSLIFAIICNIPVLPINYDPKVSFLAKRIGVSSYRPHHDIPIKFESISNRYEIRQAAEMNFELLEQHLLCRL